MCLVGLRTRLLLSEIGRTDVEESLLKTCGPRGVMSGFELRECDGVDGALTASSDSTAFLRADRLGVLLFGEISPSL